MSDNDMIYLHNNKLDNDMSGNDTLYFTSKINYF